jgi:DNA-binding MarR family transcriptional regulator
MDDDDVRQCFCLNLRRSARHVTQLYDLRLRGSGLRTTQFQLLAAISKIGPTAQQPLADLMGMDRTTLTRNLALLERQGFVSITRSRRDGREREAELTLSGQSAFRDALPRWKEAQAAMKRSMSMNAALPSFTEAFHLIAEIYSTGHD